MSKKFFPDMATGFSDPRANVKICDGLKFVEVRNSHPFGANSAAAEANNDEHVQQESIGRLYRPKSHKSVCSLFRLRKTRYDRFVFDHGLVEQARRGGALSRLLTRPTVLCRL